MSNRRSNMVKKYKKSIAKVKKVGDFETVEKYIDGIETVTDHNGFVWENGGSSTDDHLAWGGHEPELVQIAKGMLPEGGTFLDVGAHVGLYSINLAGKAGDVYAIEANPLTYEVLIRNVARNSAKFDSTIHTLNIAAWDVPATLDLEDANDKETGGSTRCIPAKKAGAGKVAAWPLDGVLPERCNPDLIKIDVEGAEYNVLLGLSNTIARAGSTLFIEMHDMYFGEQIRTDVLWFLNKIGYEWSDSLKYGGSYYIVAHPPHEQTIEVVKAGQ